MDKASKMTVSLTQSVSIVFPDIIISFPSHVPGPGPGAERGAVSPGCGFVLLGMNEPLVAECWCGVVWCGPVV